MKRKGRILALLMAAALAVSALCAAAEPLAFEADAGDEAERNLPQDGAAEIIDEQSDESNAQEEAAAPDSDALAATGFLMDGDTLVVYEGEGGDVVIPDGVKVIGPVAFSELPELRSVEIPASVERIEEYAFANCENLEAVRFSEGLLEIGDHAFENCASLRDIELPASLVRIGEAAFPESMPEPQGAAEGNEEVVSEPAELLLEDAEESRPVALSEIGYPDALTIGVKEAVTPEVNYVPASEEDGLTYSTSDARIAKVDASGKITGVRKGEATITVQSASGASASCHVTVLAAPKKASFAQSKGALGVGQTQRLELTLSSGAASHQITWKSSDEGVATVRDGLVTAVSQGSAKITAKTYNNKKASYTLSVKPGATAVRAAEVIKLCVGQTPYAPELTLEPADALSDIGFASDNEGVVAVEDSKLVAKQTGSATVTVTARNGEHTASAQIAVTVVEAPAGIEIANPVEALGVKESYTFRAELAGDAEFGAHNAWSSDKPGVLKLVDAAKGEFKALKKGSANVTVTSANGLTASVPVKVQSAPSKLTLSAKKGTLGLNETVQLTAKLPKNAASQITWESSNTAVATVENGLVTAAAPGSAKITAQTFNKKKASCNITVAAAPESIDVPPSLALGVGQKYTLDIALAPANAAGRLIVANSNEAAVQLDKGELPAANSASLKLTALALGSATLRFESYNGLSADCEVSVYSAPTSLRITNAVTLGKGETYQLQAESDSNEALLAHCTWKSSNKKVLQVDGSGKLTAKKKGTAKITAKLPKGSKTLSSKSVKIRVVDAPSGVTLDSASADLRIGGELQLTATLSPANSATQITWTSSNEAVAQVDGSGRITAVGGGEATITAQTFNGQSASCAVTVASPEAPEISINGEPASGEVPEVSDSVTLGWSSPVPAQSYDVEVSGEDGAVILDLQATSETSATIEKERMASGAIYTVRVTANHGAGSAVSASAQFKYVDPSAEPAGSAVYFTSDISAAGMLAVYNALGWTPSGNVAVKLSTGEPPASNYLRPELVKDVVQLVQGTIVECNTAYGGSRSSTAMHMQVAEDHGFTAIADVDILDAEGSLELPVNGGSRLQTNLVGGHFANYDSCVVLSHFKGHAMAGFGGAIKNISIGLGSQEGKCLIHTGGRSHTSPWGGDQTAFTESMAEAGKSVSDYMGNGARIVYINVLNNISIDCDCDGNPAAPDIHDIGILASTDPVAIDQASIDLCFDAEGSESLQRRVANQNGLHTLEHAEEIGLGSREYHLVNIDD